MAELIRISNSVIGNLQVDPAKYLPEDELKQYEILEGQIERLSAKDRRRYEHLMLTAIARYDAAVVGMDQELAE